MHRAQRQQIDWDAVHATLAARTSAPVFATAETARAERLLTERTSALAARPRSTPTAERRVLMVRTGPERYALPLEAAREVIEPGRVAPLTGVARAIAGIINWRGEFVVVFDLAVIVGATAAAKSHRAIVLSGQDPPPAIAVDAVEEIATIDLSTLQPPEHLSPQRAALFRGATTDTTLVFDVPALMARLKQESQAA